MKEYIFQCFISRKNYTEKPNSKNLKSEQTLLKEYLLKTGKEANTYSLEQIAKHISTGKTITSTITDTTRMLILDIDNGINEKDLVKILKDNDIVPNIYYRTFSWDPTEGKYKMRLIYKLKETLTKEEYDDFYNVLTWFFPTWVNEENKIKSILDTNLRNFDQLIHGTNQQTKLIHGKSFSVEEFKKKIGYVPPPIVVKEKKEYIQSDIKNIKDIIQQMENDLNGLVDESKFKRSYYMYHMLKKYGYENELDISEKWRLKHSESKEPIFDNNDYYLNQLKRIIN